MIQSITTQVQMTLAELFQHIVDHDLSDKCCVSSYGNEVEVNTHGEIRMDGYFTGEDQFDVEVELEITEDTAFTDVVVVASGGMLNLEPSNSYTIKGILHRYDHVRQIHAVVDSKLELIWEQETAKDD